MKTALRLFLLTALLLALLSTIALGGALQWLSTHDTVRLFIDGAQVRLNLDSAVGWLPLLAGLAAGLLIVFLVVPLAVLLALAVSVTAGMLGLAAALSPLLLLGALAWWLVKRPNPPPPAPPAPSPPAAYPFPKE